jgi:hypothetical protein
MRDSRESVSCVVRLKEEEMGEGVYPPSQAKECGSN